MQVALANTAVTPIPSAYLNLPEQFVVIPLPSSKVLEPAVAESSRTTLAVTVQLSPATVCQQWLLDPPELVKKSNVRSADRLPPSSWAKPCKGVRYHLPCATLDQYTDLRGLSRLGIDKELRVCQSSVFLRLTQLMLSSIDSPELVPPSFMDDFVMMFCAQVIHTQRSPAEQPTTRGGLSAWQKRRALELLDQSRRRNVTLPSLAKECRLSVSHFARSFKVSFGMPVHQWVVDQRVQQSKSLLLHSNKPLTEIAYLTGFSEQASFNRTFTKMTGSSPGRWRRAHKDPIPKNTHRGHSDQDKPNGFDSSQDNGGAPITSPYRRKL